MTVWPSRNVQGQEAQGQQYGRGQWHETRPQIVNPAQSIAAKKGPTVAVPSRRWAENSPGTERGSSAWAGCGAHGTGVKAGLVVIALDAAPPRSRSDFSYEWHRDGENPRLRMATQRGCAPLNAA